MDKILEIFIMEPEKEFHVRELAKRFKKSPTTISKKLKFYEKNHLLKSEKKLNHLLFKANSSLLFKQKKINYNLERIYFSGLIDFIRNEFNYPKAIVLFGSWASGENAKISDLDILVVSPVDKNVDLNKFKRKLGDIQLFVLSDKKIKKMVGNNPELVNSFINGIVLDGLLEVF